MAVALPTIVSGDYLYVSVCTTTTVTTPTGYTLLDSQTAFDAKLYVFARTTDGTEGSTLNITVGTTTQTVATAVSVQGGGNPVTAHNTANNASTLAQTIVGQTGGVVLYFQGSADGSGVSCTPPGGFTELRDASAQFDFRQASLGYISSPNSNTYGGTFTITSSCACSVVLVALAPTLSTPVTSTQIVESGVTAAQIGGVATSQVGVASGVASLDSTANVPSGQLTNVPALPSTPSWESFQDPGVGGRVVKVLISKYDSNRIYVSGDMLGIGVSFDGGQTFGGGFGLPSWEMGSFTEHPTEPNVIWCGSMSGPVQSVDGGVNWALKRSGFPATSGSVYSAPVEKILFDPANSNHLLAFGGSWRIWKFFSLGGVASGGYGSVWESTNGGSSWALKSTVSANENITWATGASDWSKIWVNTQHNGIYVSTDQGATWAQSNTGLLHLAGSSVVLDPNSSNQTLYSSFMTSGTISATLSSGLSTSGAITSLPINAFASTAIPSTGSIPSGVGLNLTTSGHSQNWTTAAPVHIGDTTITVSSQTPNFAYPSGSTLTTFLPGGVYKSTNGGSSWALSGTGQPQVQNTTQSFCTWLDSVHLTTDGILYFGDQNTGSGANNVIWKSTDSGATWTSITPSIARYFPGPRNFHQFTDDPATPGSLWGGTNDGLGYTTDAGVTWHDGADLITNSGALRGRGYSGILGVRVTFNKWRKGWVALNGFDSGNFNLTKDGGQSWTGPLWSPWDFFDGGYDTAFGGPTGNIIYTLLGQAGIFNGVLVSQDAGATWTAYTSSNSPLPSRFASVGGGDQNGLEIISADGQSCLVAFAGTLYLTQTAGVGVNAPTTPVPTTNSTGGTVVDGTYKVQIAYNNVNGVSLPSGTATVTANSGGANTNTITVPSPSASGNATGYFVYISAVGGSSPTLQNASQVPIGTNYVLTAPPISGAGPAGLNHSTWNTISGAPGASDVAVTPDFSMICVVNPGAVPRVSTDGGNTWTAENGVVGGTPHLTRVVAGPDGSFWGAGYFNRFGGSTNSGVWRRPPGAAGQTWAQKRSSGGDEDVAVDPYDANHIIVANDQNPFNDISTAGGVIESRDGGTTWKAQNAGLRMTRVMSVAFDPFEAGRVVCGTDGGGYFTAKMYGTATPVPKGLHSGVAGVPDVPNLELRLRKLQNELDTFVASTTNLNGVIVSGTPLSGQTILASTSTAAAWTTPLPFNLRGNWSNGQTYNVNDLVSRLGGSYVCLTNGTTSDPSIDAVNWMQMTAPGANFSGKGIFRLGNHALPTTSGNTSAAITVPATGHSAGNLLIVAGTISNSGATGIACTDSRSNTYTGITNTALSGTATFLFRSLLTTNLQPADAITVSWTGSTNTIILDSIELNGYTALDVSGTVATTTQQILPVTPSGLTPTLSGECAIAIMGYGGSISGTYNTNGTTGFTLVNDFSNTVSAQARRMSWAFSIRADTSLVNPEWTINTGTNSGSGVGALFK